MMAPMNERQTKKILADLERAFISSIESLSPELIQVRGGKAAALRDFKKSATYRLIKARCIKLPEKKIPAMLRAIEAMPVLVRKQLRDWTRECAEGFGGKNPLLPDHLRREVVVKIKGLQESGWKRKKAIEQIAPNYGLEPKQLEGILKHGNRYKDTPQRSATKNFK